MQTPSGTRKPVLGFFMPEERLDFKLSSSVLKLFKYKYLTSALLSVAGVAGQDVFFRAPPGPPGPFQHPPPAVRHAGQVPPHDLPLRRRGGQLQPRPPRRLRHGRAGRGHRAVPQGAGQDRQGAGAGGARRHASLQDLLHHDHPRASQGNRGRRQVQTQKKIYLYQKTFRFDLVADR